MLVSCRMLDLKPLIRFFLGVADPVRLIHKSLRLHPLKRSTNVKPKLSQGQTDTVHYMSVRSHNQQLQNTFLSLPAGLLRVSPAYFWPLPNFGLEHIFFEAGEYNASRPVALSHRSLILWNSLHFGGFTNISPRVTLLQWAITCNSNIHKNSIYFPTESAVAVSEIWATVHKTAVSSHPPLDRWCHCG